MPGGDGVAISDLTNLAFGTAEAVIFTSTPAKGIRAGQKVLVLVWIVMTTGGTQTNTLFRIRRGSTTAGVEITNASAAEAIYAAAGATEDHVIMALDNASVDDPVYSLTASTGVAAGTKNQVIIAIIPIG